MTLPIAGTSTHAIHAHTIAVAALFQYAPASLFSLFGCVHVVRVRVLACLVCVCFAPDVMCFAVKQATTAYTSIKHAISASLQLSPCSFSHSRCWRHSFCRGTSQSCCTWWCVRQRLSCFNLSDIHLSLSLRPSLRPSLPLPRRTSGHYSWCACSHRIGSCVDLGTGRLRIEQRPVWQVLLLS